MTSMMNPLDPWSAFPGGKPAFLNPDTLPPGAATTPPATPVPPSAVPVAPGMVPMPRPRPQMASAGPGVPMPGAPDLSASAGLPSGLDMAPTITSTAPDANIDPTTSGPTIDFSQNDPFAGFAPGGDGGLGGGMMDRLSKALAGVKPPPAAQPIMPRGQAPMPQLPQMSGGLAQLLAMLGRRGGGRM